MPSTSKQRKGGVGSNQYQQRGAPVPGATRAGNGDVVAALSEEDAAVEAIGSAFLDDEALLHVAQTATSAERLDVIATAAMDRGHEAAVLAVMDNEHTGTDTLTRVMYSTENANANYYAAWSRHPNADRPELVTIMYENVAYSSSDRERWENELLRGLASRSDLDDLDASYLADDDDEQVRLNVAHNPHVSPSVLLTLSRDDMESARYSVIANPAAPVEALLSLAAQYPRARQWDEVVDRGDCPTEVLDVLAVEGNPEVRVKVAEDPRLSVDTLQRMHTDSNATVRRAAWTQLLMMRNEPLSPDTGG